MIFLLALLGTVNKIVTTPSKTENKAANMFLEVVIIVISGDIILDLQTNRKVVLT